MSEYEIDLIGRKCLNDGCKETIIDAYFCDGDYEVGHPDSYVLGHDVGSDLQVLYNGYRKEYCQVEAETVRNYFRPPDNDIQPLPLLSKLPACPICGRPIDGCYKLTEAECRREFKGKNIMFVHEGKFAKFVNNEMQVSPGLDVPCRVTEKELIAALRKTR